MVNTEIRLIVFFAAKDGEAVYSQEKQNQALTVAQIMILSLFYSYFNTYPICVSVLIYWSFDSGLHFLFILTLLNFNIKLGDISWYDILTL